MRHEKHTQSSSIPEALALPNNAAAADPITGALISFYTIIILATKTFTALLFI